jgi:hypothetical protein
MNFPGIRIKNMFILVSEKKSFFAFVQSISQMTPYE